MGALIFDFDGVIADSEAIANTVLAESVSGLGHSTTLDQALTRYSGRRWDECVAEIEAAIGRPLPSDFSGQLKRATLERFRTDLKEVSGATDFIGVLLTSPDASPPPVRSIACSYASRCWRWNPNSAVMFSARTWSRAESRTRTFSCSPRANSACTRTNVLSSRTALAESGQPLPPE